MSSSSVDGREFVIRTSIFNLFVLAFFNLPMKVPVVEVAGENPSVVSRDVRTTNWFVWFGTLSDTTVLADVLLLS